MSPLERVTRRYEAAARQGWLCCQCGEPMGDRRDCSEPWHCEHNPSGVGDRHASTLEFAGEVRAAHNDCVLIFHANGKQEGLMFG